VSGRVDAPSERRLRIGLTSAAHLHADAYTPLLSAMPDVDLIGMTDRDAARGRAFASIHGVRFLPDLAALLAEGPDAVVVTSENSVHRADVEEAAAAGVHVLTEKPIATSVRDGRAMVDACGRAGVQLMTAFPMRASAAARELRASIASGEIGAVRAIVGVNQGQLPIRHRAWFVDPVLAGGGALMDHVVHLVDLYRWMLGVEVVDVFAVTNRILHADRAAVETGGLLLLTLEGGIMATVDCSWSRPDGFPTWGGMGMEVVGDRGVLELDGFRQRIARYGAAAGDQAWLQWGSDPDRGMLRDFVDAIRGGSEVPITGLDGLRALEVVEAAYRSAATGETVAIADL
jgi:predicted dehydrogenase